MLSCFLACQEVDIFRESVDDELKKVSMDMDSSYHDYLGHYLDDLDNLCQGADKRKIKDHLNLYSHDISNLYTYLKNTFFIRHLSGWQKKFSD